jgi:hypothetical protein
VNKRWFMFEPGRPFGSITLECIGIESPTVKRPIEAFDYLVGRIDVVARPSLAWQSFMKVLDTVGFSLIPGLHIRQGNGLILVSVMNATPLYFGVQMFGAAEKSTKVLLSFGYQIPLLALVQMTSVSLLDSYLPTKVRRAHAARPSVPRG